MENSSLSEVIFLLRLYEGNKTPFSNSEFSELSLLSQADRNILFLNIEVFWDVSLC